MQELFMKKNEQLRFELLKLLIYSKKGLSTNEVSQKLNIPNHSFYIYRSQLEEDLAVVFKENSVILEKKETYYSITSSLNISYIIDTMRLYYIKISQTFSILNALSYRYYDSAEELSQNLNLSLSHTYKILGFFNQLLEPFDISINFSSKKKQSNIIGNEKNRRLVMFYVYWSVYKGVEWPFKFSPTFLQELPAPIDSQLLSPSQKMRLNYFQVITYWHLSYKLELISLPKDFLPYLEVFQKVSPTSFADSIKESLRKRHVSDQHIYEEELFFGFLARFFISNIDSPTNKIRIATMFIDSSLPITTFTSKFLNDFLKKYNVSLTQENYAASYYLIIFHLFYVKFFTIDSPFSEISDDAPFTAESSDGLFKIHETELAKFIHNNWNSELFPPISTIPSLVTYLAKLLYLVLITSNKHRPLNVLIQHSKTIYGYDLIKNKLLIFFKDTTLRITFDINEADIIISDSFEKNNDTPFFYFEHPEDTEAWKNLISFISQELYSLLR
ncbi:helix-turn-helix domain-containing protein [Candidatus Enterococcus mansonii]|uniref:Mga helix-turn-helix domain-containing protein n=1 Tax=Candidatus Enterococcus mansonii TaxID=1834181 RepID=A0A242CDC6_9ENTE|nr:helix-turn-helix domain-containing protein [Enterococcus sp. 4G2_DIV0659]OTO07772.1 hypothetical protein A5880_002042 [Enterococcus sp. 4G2_DIV0659]